MGFLNGNSNDMTKGKIMPLLLSYSAPMIVCDILQSSYTLVDTAILGKYVGTEALAGVSSVTYIMMLILALGMGLRSGATVLAEQEEIIWFQ